METKPTGSNKDLSAARLEKTEREKEDEYINIFKYFENANIRNREAFCELLDYTMENKRNQHK